MFTIDSLSRQPTAIATRAAWRGLRGIAVAAFLVAAAARAQEVFAAPGRMYTPTLHATSFAFPYGYEQYFQFKGYDLGASVIWLNEGHVPGHHRDGVAFQSWYVMPFYHEKLFLQIGIGPYVYFDTVPDGSVYGSKDLHGVAPIESIALSFYPDKKLFNWEWTRRFFVRASLNYDEPNHNIKVGTADFGGGFYFGGQRRYHPFATDRGGGATNPDEANSSEEQPITPWEITPMVGFSIENAHFGYHRYAAAAEVRKGVLKYVDLTVTYFDEVNLATPRRTGLGSQAWAVHNFFNDRVALGMGAGLYTAIGRRKDLPPGQYLTPFVMPFFSPAITVNFCQHAYFRVTWNRVTGYHDPDADVLIFGIGASFGRTHSR